MRGAATPVARLRLVALRKHVSGLGSGAWLCTSASVASEKVTRDLRGRSFDFVSYTGAATVVLVLRQPNPRHLWGLRFNYSPIPRPERAGIPRLETVGDPK